MKWILDSVQNTVKQEEEHYGGGFIFNEKI